MSPHSPCPRNHPPLCRRVWSSLYYCLGGPKAAPAPPDFGSRTAAGLISGQACCRKIESDLGRPAEIFGGVVAGKVCFKTCFQVQHQHTHHTQQTCFKKDSKISAGLPRDCRTSSRQAKSVLKTFSRSAALPKCYHKFKHRFYETKSLVNASRCPLRPYFI